MANIGRVVISSTKSTIVAPSFAPKPNISLAEIKDVSTIGVEDGSAIVFSSANNRYETKTITSAVVAINGGQF